ncbi:hypothetical protein WA538_001715, partial [Blastocystis sp. DL]
MCRESVACVAKEIGSPTSLVNVAGINKDGLLLRYKESDMESLLRTNLVGSMLLSRSVLPYMMKSKRGSIVSIGSVVGERGRAGQSVYAATKSALVGFSRSLAKEMGRYNIRVNMVTPGFIQTEMTEQSIRNVDEFSKRIALQRLGVIEDVSNAVAFLLSDEASYITGAVLPVDGGIE